MISLEPLRIQIIKKYVSILRVEGITQRSNPMFTCCGHQLSYAINTQLSLNGRASVHNIMIPLTPKPILWTVKLKSFKIFYLFLIIS